MQPLKGLSTSKDQTSQALSLPLPRIKLLLESTSLQDRLCRTMDENYHKKLDAVFDDYVGVILVVPQME